MIDPYKKKTLTKLKQSRGLIDKVISMVEEDVYCINIIQQSLAVQGFLKSADQQILASHLKTCGKLKEKMINEIIHVCALARK